MATTRTKKTPPNFSEANARLAQDGEEALRRERELVESGQKLTAAEERAPYRVVINGTAYYMPSLLEWTFVQDEAILEAIEPLLPIMTPLFVGDGFGVRDIFTNLPDLLRLIVQEKRHRRLLALALIPEGEEFDIARVEEIEEDMGHAKNATLREVVRRFFTTGGV